MTWPSLDDGREQEETIMAWNKPKLVEVCVGLEINGYLPSEY